MLRDVARYGEFRPLAAAVAQVSQVSSPETIEKARTILVEARRSLYRLLAEDESTSAPPGGRRRRLNTRWTLRPSRWFVRPSSRTPGAVAYEPNWLAL